MSFDIVTYCSNSYFDAYKQHVPSWLNNTSAKRVIVYTDSDKIKIMPLNSKVIVRKQFNKCNNWVTNVGRKTKCILDYLDTDPSEYMAFIEIDCYVLNDFKEVFKPDVDISVTRMFSQESYTHATITCGVWFAKVSEDLYTFMKDWHNLSRKYKDLGIGVTEKLIAYDQLSFTDLIRPAFANQTLRINAINERVYNFEHSDKEQWIEKIEEITPKIIHFKGQRFRDSEFVNEILDNASKRKKINDQNKIDIGSEESSIMADS